MAEGNSTQENLSLEANDQQPTSSSDRRATESCSGTVKNCDLLKDLGKLLRTYRTEFRMAGFDLDESNDDGVVCCLNLSDPDLNAADLIEKLADTRATLDALLPKLKAHFEHHRRQYQDLNKERWDYFKRNTNSGNVMTRSGSRRTEEKNTSNPTPKEKSAQVGRTQMNVPPGCDDQQPNTPGDRRCGESGNTGNQCDVIKKIDTMLRMSRRELRKAGLELDEANDDAVCCLHHCDLETNDLLGKVRETMETLNELEPKLKEHFEQRRKQCPQKNKDKWEYFHRNTNSGDVLIRADGTRSNNEEKPDSADSGVLEDQSFTTEGHQGPEEQQQGFPETRHGEMSLSSESNLDAMADCHLGENGQELGTAPHHEQRLSVPLQEEGLSVPLQEERLSVPQQEQEPQEGREPAQSEVCEDSCAGKLLAPE